jgi:hypothetical protein
MPTQSRRSLQEAGGESMKLRGIASTFSFLSPFTLKKLQQMPLFVRLPIAVAFGLVGVVLFGLGGK